MSLPRGAVDGLAGGAMATACDGGDEQQGAGQSDGEGQGATHAGGSFVHTIKAPPHMRRMNVHVSSPSDNLSPCSQRLISADRVKG